MADYNNAEKARAQYQNADNLRARMQLHARFSTNPQGWYDWLFAQYPLRPGMKVLELGCGTAAIWQQNRHRIPADTYIILSDFSPGMLAEAERNTSGIAAEYRVIDAQEIPFEGNSFDLVIANHMLYHVPDLPKALGEIARVLQPGGTLCASTIGENNLRELHALTADFDAASGLAQGSVAKTFGLENGADILKPFFACIEMVRHADGLHITEPQPLLDYIFSARDFGDGADAQPLEQHILEIFRKSGYLDVQKDAGIFIATQVIST